MNIWSVWRKQLAREQSAAWHTRIARGMTESQRRRFEIWIADRANAREFQSQRALVDAVAKVKGVQAKGVVDSISSVRQVKLAKPPASRYVFALKWLLTENSYTKIVAPLVAQEQHEYYEAIRCGDTARARWIEVRMYVLIGYSVFLALLAPIAKLFRSAS